MNGTGLAAAVTESVNSGIEPEDFKAGIQNAHNALQRYAFQQVFKPGIVALAGVDYTDARNKRTVEQAREIADHMDWDY